MVSPPGRVEAPLSDNPPGYNGGPGIERDQAWLNYLAYYQPGGPLPNPDAVSNPALRRIGAMALQQGMRYSYGGGHEAQPGPTHGNADSGPDDTNIIGLDCSGALRYAEYEASGIDPGALATGGMEAQARLANGSYTMVNPSDIQPGDYILCEYQNGQSQHVEMYIGNDQYIDANQSGDPIATTSSIPQGQHTIIRATGRVPA